MWTSVVIVSIRVSSCPFNRIMTMVTAIFNFYGPNFKWSAQNAYSDSSPPHCQSIFIRWEKRKIAHWTMICIHWRWKDTHFGTGYWFNGYPQSFIILSIRAGRETCLLLYTREKISGKHMISSGVNGLKSFCFQTFIQSLISNNNANKQTQQQ